jgi:deoxyribose-phosphate aldolase
MSDFPPSLIIEHTLLKPTTTDAQVVQVCEEAVEYGFAAVCIPPVYVARAAEQVHGSEVHVCTVVGFPAGFECTATKVYAAHQALKNGAHEIDMVVQQGWIQDARYDDIESEIRQVKEACRSATLKVIIECCNLNAEQKRRTALCVATAGADYVKTSTGTGSRGATLADVELLYECVGANTGIKAAGGIRTLEQLNDLHRAGARRIGTSAGVDIVQEWLTTESR